MIVVFGAVRHGQVAVHHDDAAIIRGFGQVAVDLVAVQIEGDGLATGHDQRPVGFIGHDVAVARQRARAEPYGIVLAGQRRVAARGQQALQQRPAAHAERRRHGDGIRGHGEGILRRVCLVLRGRDGLRRIIPVGVRHGQGIRRLLVACVGRDGQCDGVVLGRVVFAGFGRHAAVLAGLDDDVRRGEGDVLQVVDLIRDVAGIEAAVAAAEILAA